MSGRALGMQIASVQTRIVRVPFTHGDPGSTGRAGNLRLKAMNTLLVRVETRSGLVGWGEAFGFDLVDATKAAIDTVITPLCLGLDAGNILGVEALLRRRLHNYGRNGSVSFGISGIDIALWDIAGKLAGKPLHELLGEARRTRVPAYASLLRYGDAQTVARNVREALAKGYRAIKLHEVDPSIIRAGREAAGPRTRLLVDVNCPWTTAEAIAAARDIEDTQIGWLEEPVWPPEDFEGLAQVAASSPVPIAAGENITTVHEFRTMFALGAVTYAQPSVTKIGLSGLLAVAAAAGEHGVRIAPHSPYFGPGLLATVQFAAASGEPVAVEHYGCSLEADLFDDAIMPVAGEIAVPEAPGLGLEPLASVVARFGS